MSRGTYLNGIDNKCPGTANAETSVECLKAFSSINCVNHLERVQLLLLWPQKTLLFSSCRWDCTAIHRLGLQSSLDHIQRKHRAPSDNARNATAEENLQSSLMRRIIPVCDEALAKFIRPETIMVSTSTAASRNKSCKHKCTAY